MDIFMLRNFPIWQLVLISSKLGKYVTLHSINNFFTLWDEKFEKKEERYNTKDVL